MRKLTIVIVLVATSLTTKAQEVNLFFNAADAFFKTYVSNGKVAYSKIYKNQEPLNNILQIASNVSNSKKDINVYQAFWINAYNITVIKGIIDNYPTNSPLDDNGFFDKTTYDLGGNTITLNDIEHKLLRGQFNDARFHFVLVCGALGCPPLISEAYMPNTLNEQMNTQTEKALNGTFLRVNTKKKRVEVSQIMEWYKEDFIMNDENEIGFINKYRTEKIPVNFKLNYFPYDWKVNEQ